MRARDLLSGPFLRVTLANFFFFLNFASFFLLPLHVKALGGTEATVGSVMGTAGLAGLCALPLVGATIDRYGRRRYLVGGYGVMTLASCCYLLIDHVGPALFALRVCQGIGFAAAFTAATTLAAELAPPGARAQALGFFGISTLGTHAIAPAIGEEVVRIGGFPMLFAAAAGVSTIALGCAMSVPGGRARGADAARRADWRMDRLQWGLGGTVIFCGLAFGAVITFVPTFVRESELGRVGTFFAVYTGAAVLTRVVGGGLSDALGRRTVIVPTLLMLGGAILLLSFVRSIPMLALAAAVFGLGQGLSYPTLNALAVDIGSDGHLGRVQAIFNGAFNLGVTSSAFVFGLVAERFGYRPMFALAALTPVAALLVFSVAMHGTTHGGSPRPRAASGQAGDDPGGLEMAQERGGAFLRTHPVAVQHELRL